MLYYLVDQNNKKSNWDNWWCVIMKIQKGIVKYKDRNDIVCTYAVTDDGKQYYFLDEKDEKKLANGGRIASTELIEAIDPMVKSTHIGVIGNDGREIIPFRYKSTNVL